MLMLWHTNEFHVLPILTIKSIFFKYSSKITLFIAKFSLLSKTNKFARLIWVFIVLGIYNFAFKQDIFYHLVKTTQELFSFQQSRLDKQFPFHYAKKEKFINSCFFRFSLKSYMIWISDSCDFFESLETNDKLQTILCK